MSEIRATKTGERVTVESLGMVAEAFSFAALKRNGLGIRYFALSIPLKASATSLIGSWQLLVRRPGLFFRPEAAAAAAPVALLLRCPR
jgi:hypothetical protein